MVRSKSKEEVASTQFQEDPLIPLWDVEGVQRYLSIGRDRVYELVNEEELPFLLFGKQEYRFYPFAVRDWVKKRLQTK
jgi:excisionase family DNA binding protein